MKKKGFTLIELLAVIVILAVIALIAVPLITKVIQNAKEESAMRSAELYSSALIEQIQAKMMSDENLEISSCTVNSDGTATCGSKTITVVTKETTPTSGTINISNGKIVNDSTLKINGYCLKYSNKKWSITECNSNDTNVAVLTTGLNFNNKIKTLAMGTNINYVKQNYSNPNEFMSDDSAMDSADASITEIIFCPEGSLPSGFNKSQIEALSHVDVSNSNDESIIAYLDDSVVDQNKIYVLCDKKIKLNSDSSYMFFTLGALNSVNLDDVIATDMTDLSYMFVYDTALTNLDLSNFDTSKVTNMSYMFMYAFTSEASYENSTLNINNWNTSNVTNMQGMFLYTYLKSLDLSSFDTSNVTNMSYMFMANRLLSTLNISSFSTQNVTDMSYMFEQCMSLTTLDLHNFNTSSVTNMESMFSGCLQVTTLDVSSFDTSQVTNMNRMFRELNLITNLDLSSFDTSRVTDMSYMFAHDDELDCENMTKIYVSNLWNTDAVTESSNMFKNTLYLVGNNGTTYTSGNPEDKTYARIDTPSTPGYFSTK